MRTKMTTTFPKRITKNGREHTLPIAPFARELLPLRDGLLFPARGQDDRAFNGWSNSMSALREAAGIKDFTLHDLPRTAATMMAALGVLPHVIERILNHVTGSTAHIIKRPIARSVALMLQAYRGDQHENPDQKRLGPG